MDRRSFLKRFGIGAAVAVSAPAIAKAALPEIADSITEVTEDKPVGVWEQMHKENMRPHHAQYPLTPDQCYMPYEEHYIDNISEYLQRERMRKYWPELVRRYGHRQSIIDFVTNMP